MKMDWLELLQEILQVIIYTVITGCGVVIVKKILVFLNKKIDDVQANTKLAEYEKLNRIIDRAQETIYSIVIAVNQTFVDDLKKSEKFDKEAASQAKDLAIEKAKEMLTEEAIEAITQVKGNVDAFINTNIEAVINQLKQDKNN
jgi:hypothetical protein